MSVFAAIADSTRRSIVDLLSRHGRLSSTEISDRFEISSAAISQHLKVLREAGLVQVETRAQQRIYSIDPRGFDEVEEWLNRARRFWSLRLDELERQLKSTAKESRRKK